MTRSFARVERFFERLFERPAARLFRAPVQPVQLQRRLEREMEDGRVANADRTYVPNRFRILLHPSDAAQFQDDRTMLQADLADAVLRRARVRGYRLVARPEVIIIPSEEVPAGEADVSADPLDPGLVRSAAAGLRPVELEGPRPPRPPIPETAPVPVAGPSASAEPAHASDVRSNGDPAPVPAQEPISALIEVATPGARPWGYVFHDGVVRIGRGMENELVLEDDRVSRRHGQLTLRQGTLVYTDLGSSNGSTVNGGAVREIALGVGDVVRVGNSTLTIRPGG